MKQQLDEASYKLQLTGDMCLHDES